MRRSRFTKTGPPLWPRPPPDPVAPRDPREIPMTTPTPVPPTNRDGAHWATPVDRLSAAGVAGAKDDAVSGKRATGPLQGFGRLWQKTVTVRLDGTDISPTDLIVLWKERFPTFWPKGATFYAPLAGIAPGEVALLDV